MPTIALIKIEQDEDGRLKITAPEIGETYYYDVVSLPNRYQIILHMDHIGVTGVTLKDEPRIGG